MKLRAEGASHTRIVEVGETIGKGGEGRIARVEGSDTLAVKLFAKDAEERRVKIERMARLGPAHSDVTKATSAWPSEPLFDGDGQTFVGFTMPFFAIHANKESAANSHVELQAMLVGRQRKALGLRGDFKSDFAFRLTIAQNLAQLVHEVHAAGHAIIDLKPPNVLVDKNTGGVVLVDCDSCRISDPEEGHVFPAKVVTPEFLAPECQKEMSAGTQYQDRFALGMILFKLLNNDQSPTQGVIETDGDSAGGIAQENEAADWDTRKRIEENFLTTNPASALKPGRRSVQALLPDKTVELFGKAFGVSKSLRPSAKSWMRHLVDLENAMTECADNPAYVDLGKGCLGTALDQRGARRANNDGGGGAASGSSDPSQSGDAPSRAKQPSSVRRKTEPEPVSTQNTATKTPKKPAEPAVEQPTPEPEKPIVAKKPPPKRKPKPKSEPKPETTGGALAEAYPPATGATVLWRSLSGIAVLALSALVTFVTIMSAADWYRYRLGNLPEMEASPVLGLTFELLSALAFFFVMFVLAALFFVRSYLASFPIERGAASTSPGFNLLLGLIMLGVCAAITQPFIAFIYEGVSAWSQSVAADDVPRIVALGSVVILGLLYFSMITLFFRILATFWSRDARAALKADFPVLR
ncbi:MAG: hypothetical protein AAF127_09840 [Pseudomonadota bacterium]